MQPTLRFPEFKREWSYNLFSNIVTNRSKKFNPSTEEATNDIELDSIEQNTGRLLNTYMSNQFTSQKNIFNKNSVLYSKLRPYLNKYYYSQIDGVCSSEIWVLNTLNKDVLSNKFLYYFIQTNRFSSVANKSAGSKMPRADWGLVENIRLYRGTIEEQEKIGEFFSKLDQQIELEEKKLELLKQQKRGYMQKIFSQDLRFKDENGNEYSKWVTQKIKELGNVYTGNTPSKKQSANWNSNNYIWVTPTDINNKKDIKNSEYMLSDEGFKKARQLPKNTLLITCIASIGKNAILREVGSCNQQINALVPNNDKNVDFLYYAFEKVSKYMKRIAGKTATQIVNKSTFENISIEVPNLEEQLKIGIFLNSFDKLIEKKVSKIELLKQRKQGLLQKMFV